MQIEGSRVQPVLQRLDAPVRAIVAPITDSVAASKLRDALGRHITPQFASAGLWLQDAALYHTTVWHASPHQVHVCCACALC